MTNGRGRPKKLPVNDKSEADFDYTLSQPDDQHEELLEAFQKQYTATLEKQRARKEKKFLEDAEKELNKESEATAKLVQDAMRELENLYQKFLVDYAVVEDKIRKKWTFIQKEEEKLITVLEKKDKNDQQLLQEASTRQLSGLSKIRTACNASQRAIDRFRNPEPDVNRRTRRAEDFE